MGQVCYTTVRNVSAKCYCCYLGLQLTDNVVVSLVDEVEEGSKEGSKEGFTTRHQHQRASLIFLVRKSRKLIYIYSFLTISLLKR